MLTSMFYYDHYKPYMIKTEKQPNKLKLLPKLSEASMPSEFLENQPEVSLNKSLNSNVVEYAKGIYRNTTDLKHTSKRLANDVKNYSKYKDYQEFDQQEFEESFDQDLDRFSESYNRSREFMLSQEHSKMLGDDAEAFDSIVSNSEKILDAMGIKKDEEGMLLHSPGDNRLWNGKNTDRKMEAAGELFNDINSKASEILSNPMANHMDFKNLNYYYNYEVDKINVDSFQIIKTGMLVNLGL